MLLKLGYGTYVFFGCFCTAAGIFSYFFVPEVAGKTLEEVGQIFGDQDVAEEEAIRQRILEEIWDENAVEKHSA